MLYNADGFSLDSRADRRTEPVAGIPPLRRAPTEPRCRPGSATGCATDGVAIFEEWDEPEYVSVKCLDPDGYVVEAAWEPHLR